MVTWVSVNPPLLFLDVDGPLNPYAAQQERRPEGYTTLRVPRIGVHWKTGPLVDYADGRPFAWVDDEQSEPDQTYVTAHHQGPGLLHHVNPRIGLRETDFHTLADWYDCVARMPDAPARGGD